jgi:hypothetical protein
MAQSASKSQLVADLQTYVNLLVQAKLGLADVVNNYFKNGFNSGGGSQIVDGDVTASNLTASKVASGITMAQQLANFFGNAAVTQGDYESTLQQIKTT